MTQSNWIEIVEVILVPIEESESLIGFMVDRPQAKTQVNTSELEISGWVLSKNSPAIAVEVLYNQRILRTLSVSDPRPDVAKVYPNQPTAGISGFKGTINLKAVSGENELTLQAILRDENIITLGQVKFTSPESVEDLETDIVSDKFQGVKADLKRSRAFLEQVKASLEKNS